MNVNSKSRLADMLVACVTLLVIVCPGRAAEPGSPSDWPQWRGPNRDGVAPSSPKLLDSWPKEGPPQLWKSDWIPGCEEGGAGCPVVAGGKVLVYANAKIPLDGGNGYRFVTPDLLAAAGWLADLPDDLARKIEAAWASTNRPASGWEWYNPAKTKKEGALDAFLAAKPELDKFIKDFVATLTPEEARTYGDYVRRRLCIDTPKNKWGAPNGLSWDALVKISKLKDETRHSRREWLEALNKAAPGAGRLCDDYPNYFFWTPVYRMADSMFCLDAATGKTLWRKDFPEDPSVYRNPGQATVQWWVFDSLGASGTPAVAGDKVYVAGAMGLYCFSVNDGTLVWQAKNRPVHSQVLVAGGIVYDGASGIAYNAETGKELWKNPIWPPGPRWPARDDAYRWNPPLLWTSGGRNYVVTTDGGVSQYCCLDLETGKLLWTLKKPPATFASIRGDRLILPAPYGVGGTQAYRLTEVGPEVLWKQGYNSSDAGVIHDGHLYLLDRCANIETGEAVWKSKIGIDAYCPVIMADGKVISQWGSCHQITKVWGGGYQILMYKATPDGFAELGRFFPHACHMCVPAVANGRLYVRLLDSVACYDIQEHGVYLDGVAAGSESLRFRFKQTGGGLAAKDAADGALKDVMMTEAGGAAKPAKATVDGDDIVVDIKDAVVPFGLAYAGGKAFTGKNGQHVPAFDWSAPRLLKVRKCFGTTVMLTSDLPLTYGGGWGKIDTYAVAGAKVTQVQREPRGRSVALTTDKAWKPGDAVSVKYACFPVDQGEPRRETLAFTVAEPQRAAARFVKFGEMTNGNWRGVYGADGAVIAADKGSAAPTYALVAVANKSDAIPWAAQPTDDRYLQKSGDARDRTVTVWQAGDQLDVEVELTDGKEHQVAIYCIDFGARTVLAVEALDADTNAVLDSQTVKDVTKGRYLIWNVKGQVTFRFVDTNQGEGTAVRIQGVFFDPPAK